MLDMKLIRAHPDRVKEGARRKRFDVDVDGLLELDRQRRALITEQESLRHRQREQGRCIAQLAGSEKEQAVAAVQALAERAKELTQRLREVEVSCRRIQERIPNLPAADVPEGDTDRDNVEISHWGERPVFDFEPEDHVTLGLRLGLLDLGRASKLAGPQSYILLREGALLELAVLRFTLDRLLAAGFTPMIVPTLVKAEALYGTAYFPGGEEQTYLCDRDALYLAGTSEVPVTSFHSGEILSEDDLPLLYCGVSTCYRREAGAAGRDTKGLYRVHQFNKVEQVVVCRNDEEESLRHHRFILENAEQILRALEVPYRVVNVCSGDLGMGQVQKFDIECWMPSRNNWGETHSASRFHDYQARRMDLRYRDSSGKLRFCHTLNNTAIASPRVLISILELNQEADGGVRIPRALVPYMGGLQRIDPRGRPKAL